MKFKVKLKNVVDSPNYMFMLHHYMYTEWRQQVNPTTLCAGAPTSHSSDMNTIPHWPLTNVYLTVQLHINKTKPP